MDAEEHDKRGRVATQMRLAADELEGNLEAADFYQRAAELSKGVLDGAREAMGGAEVARGPKRLGELLGPSLERLAARARGDERSVPVPWAELSGALGGGLWPGAHVLVASTGTGKTALQLQLSLEAARAGVPVLYIGLEMGELEVVARLVALLDVAKTMKVRPSDLLQGKVTGERFAALVSAAQGELAELPLELETGDAHGWDYERLVPAVRGLRERFNCDEGAPVLVVLDYLQLVSSPEGRREDLRERIGRAAYQAREAARRCNAAVLVTSSLARSNDKMLNEWGRAWPKPQTNDGVGLFDLVGLGKEAGEVEFSADSVIVMARTPKVEGKTETRMRVGVPKNRNGPACELTLCFNGFRWFDDNEESRDKAKRALEEAPPKPPKPPKKGNAAADKAAGGDDDDRSYLD